MALSDQQQHQVQSSNGPVATGTPPVELPPVEPPSAGFILQLFVIPAVVVAALIIVVALFGKLAQTQSEPASYIEAIRSGGEHVRWRKAHELANLLLTEPDLANDPKLLGELGGLLREELAKPQMSAELGQYLVGALGTFQIDQGPTSSGEMIDAITVLSSALATGRPVAVRLAAAESLARQAARMGPTAAPEAAVSALAAAARDSEPELRQRAVFALGFCGSDGATKALHEALGDADRFVRYNAANALARRGDPACEDVLREMLSTPDLTEILRGPTSAETAHRVEDLQLQTLSALEQAVEAGHLALARELRPQIEALEKSELAGVKIKAQGLARALSISR